MEQMNNTLMSMLQTMPNSSDLSKASGKDSSGAGDFQKLLDQKSQSTKTPSQSGEQKEPTEVKKDTPAAEKQDAPPQEDAQTVAKRLMQAGLVVADPSSVSSAMVTEEAIVPEEEGQMTLLTAASQTAAESTVSAAQQDIQLPEQQLQGQNQVQVQQGQEEAVVQPQQQVSQAEVQTEEQPAQTMQGEQLQQPQEEAEVEVTDAEQAPQQIFREVESTPIKVGETYQAKEPEVAQQIDTQLTQALAKGESMVRIQLTPASLGTVTVEVRQDVEGILHIVLSAHSSETRGILERSAANLQGLLANRTQQNVQVEVQRQEESQQGQNQSYDGHNGHNGQEEQRQRQRQDLQDQAASADFAQQLRLGLIPEE